MSVLSVTSTETADLSSSETVDAPGTSCGTARPLLTRLAQSVVLSRLNRITGGRILLDDECHRTVLGNGGEDELQVNLTVHDSAFYRRLASGGSLGLAQSYLQQEWTCDDLPALIRIFCRNLDRFTPGPLQRTAKTVARLTHRMARNTREGSRRNIGAHYDLGNDFFSLFLDPSMMYSAAIYPTPDCSLEHAQQHRMAQVCQRLDLQATDHLLEIGTGWGGMAIYAAEQFGCRVTTTTISQQQYEYAVQRVRKAGLEDRVTVLRKDYRDLFGSYDKLVSLEMIEAVGPQYYDTYFRRCGQLLKPDGRMLIQAIVMPEQRYDAYVRSVDFIQKYIFQGGSLPSVGVMQDSMTRNSRLRLLELNDFADGYARTLREWRQRFTAKLDDVRRLGYSEQFIRMWDYYLCYCEAAFEERSVGVVHAVWGR